MKNQKEEGNQILDDVGESRESRGTENKSEQEISTIEQAQEQIAQTTVVDGQKQPINWPPKEAQLPPIPPVGIEEAQLPEAEIARSDERELPVTPVDEFAKTIKSLESEEAFPKEEDAVDRAREVEQGQDLEEVVGQDDKKIENRK